MRITTTNGRALTTEGRDPKALAPPNAGVEKAGVNALVLKADWGRLVGLVESGREVG